MSFRLMSRKNIIATSCLCRTFSGMIALFELWNFRTKELSFPGTKVRCISTSVLSHFGPYPLRSFYYQGPKWMSSSVIFLVRSLSTSVLSTDLDVHFGPLPLRSLSTSVLFTDLTRKTKMQPAGRCSWTILFFETCHVMIKCYRLAGCQWRISVVKQTAGHFNKKSTL